MFQLHFENQVFSKISDFGLECGSLPAYSQAAFSFCKAWLSGETIFTQQTSGSTGIPKTIELHREQMQASAEATGAFFKTNQSTKLLCCLNPEYIAGKMMLVRAMVWDCPIWLVEPSSDPLKTLDFIPDFVAMVPLQVEQPLGNPASLLKLKSTPHLIIGGAQISERLRKSLVEKGIQAWQTFGMTETVSHFALAKIETGNVHYETLPGVEIGQDERGALWVKSPMSGPDKIRTNDLIELKSHNSFLWLGRADFVVNSGGIKLHPELLEQKAEASIQEVFPGSRFFFYGEKDEKLGQKLVLLIESANGSKEKAKLLQEILKNRLTKYEFPKEIYFKEAFALTQSGKIDRILNSKINA
ncbi:AMP-binding protein [Algoriphagus sp. A40]|uniref:AMP-binding protein n=1 Tax=Algoriphagus sp. A40 TaxID=1945863 RepID=UPI000986937C|nr:AMP-binding protein [Algoriphagus sp. A40]OOG78265.1 hypothetical protein B0E43_02350 [Algoriphagus sp. A40]